MVTGRFGTSLAKNLRECLEWSPERLTTTRKRKEDFRCWNFSYYLVSNGKGSGRRRLWSSVTGSGTRSATGTLLPKGSRHSDDPLIGCIRFFRQGCHTPAQEPVSFPHQQRRDHSVHGNSTKAPRPGRRSTLAAPCKSGHVVPDGFWPGQDE